MVFDKEFDYEFDWVSCLKMYVFKNNKFKIFTFKKTNF